MLLNMENAPSPMRESVKLLLKFWIDISNIIIINRLKGLFFFLLPEGGHGLAGVEYLCFHNMFPKWMALVLCLLA